MPPPKHIETAPMAAASMAATAASGTFIFSFFFCSTNNFFIQLDYDKTPGRTGGLEMCLHLETQLSSFFFSHQ